MNGIFNINSSENSYKNNLFKWNSFYNYLIEQWNNMDHSLTFKEQFKDKNVYITEFINKYNNHLILTHYNIFCDDLYKNPDSIYREARSLVIDLNTCEIVCAPFKKFFNINELPETSLTCIQEQIKNAYLIEITDKLDGSMQQARWYHDHLILTGSTALDRTKSFQLQEGYNLFTNNYIQLCKNNPDYTFIFEAILEDDKHIVNYAGNCLYLIGARNVYSGNTLTYHEIKNIGNIYNIPTTIIESVNLEQCLANQSIHKYNDKEGWVIYLRIRHPNNIQYSHSEQNNYIEYRYKLKCDDYVFIHKLANNISINDIIQKIADNSIDDLLSKIPDQYKDRINIIVNKIKVFLFYKEKKIYDYYNSIDINLKAKDFALYVQKNIPNEYQKYMYILKKGKFFNLLKFNKYITEQEIDQFLQQERINLNKLN